MESCNEQGVRLEVEINPASGIKGPALDALLQPLDSGSFQEASRKLHHSMLISEDAATAHRCANAFAAVKVRCLSFAYVHLPQAPLFFIL